MRAGTVVSFTDPRGQRHAATIEDVRGAGPSGRKRLTLTYVARGSPRTVSAVPHEDDRTPGSGFWTLAVGDVAPAVLATVPAPEPVADEAAEAGVD